MGDAGATLFLLRLLKLVLEIALFALVGQGIMYVLIRAMGAQDPRDNVFFRMLATVVSPFTWLVRKITPPAVADRHVPWAVFGLLLVAWAWTAFFAIPNACFSR